MLQCYIASKIAATSQCCNKVLPYSCATLLQQFHNAVVPYYIGDVGCSGCRSGPVSARTPRGAFSGCTRRGLAPRCTARGRGVRPAASNQQLDTSGQQPASSKLHHWLLQAIQGPANPLLHPGLCTLDCTFNFAPTLDF